MNGYIYVDGPGVCISAHFSGPEEFKASMCHLIDVCTTNGTNPDRIRVDFR
jgi:hypothetical protein